MLREKKGKFIKDDVLHWSNFGCIHSCVDCPISYRRSYMIRGLEIYNNYDKMLEEVSNHPEPLEILGNPLSDISLCKVLEVINRDNLVYHTRYIGEGCEGYINKNDTVIYHYSTLVPLDLVESTLSRIPTDKIIIAARPVSNLVGNKEYKAEIDVFNSALKIFCGLDVYIERFWVGDINCVDEYLAGMMGKDNEWVIEKDNQLCAMFEITKEIENDRKSDSPEPRGRSGS